MMKHKCRKFLLTGFNKFGGLEFNPSETIVNEVAGRMRFAGDISVTTEVLPTEFDAAGKRIQQLIEREIPDAVIGLGVALNSNLIRLERIALNLADTIVPDNAGKIISGESIVPNAPPAYWSTLPLEDIRQQLKSVGVPAEISNHAGTYVCNYVFYLARHKIELLGINAICGFIHIPQPSEQLRSPNNRSLKLSIFDIYRAVECCITVLKNQ